MPKNPSTQSTRVYPNLTKETLNQLLRPLSLFSKCESAAYVRQALLHATHKDIVPVARGVDLLPNSQLVILGEPFQRSQDKLEPITMEEHRKFAAISAASQMSNARVFFEHAELVNMTIQPILYYFGSLYFLDFVTSCIVRRKRDGSPNHGLSVSCDSQGWDFDKRWARDKCRVEMKRSGDFPFYVDALTVGGWPSLFSGFHLHAELKGGPWEAKKNPAPLLQEKQSLDYLCNFDLDRYLLDHPDLNDWLVGVDSRMVWRMTSLLLDYVIVFVASSLARYYIPAWKGILEAEKIPLFNDIRTAYQGVSEDMPYYFSDEHPFQYSFGTRIRQ